jgi:hypothetical protein
MNTIYVSYVYELLEIIGEEFSVYPRARMLLQICLRISIGLLL